MDPFNALCATYRLILFGIDVTQAPCTIRHSLELVRTCYHDVQHLIELRQTYLSLLEKRPLVLERVNSIISAATEELAEVCAILERCRPEEHRGRTSFLCRFQWIFFEEKEIRAHEPVMARHHASVLAELNFLRQIALLTPVGNGKSKPGGERKETMFFDNVLLLGDLIGGPSDGELGEIPTQMTSSAINQLSQANLGVNRASLSCTELMANAPPAYQSRPRTAAGIPAAFQGSKEVNIITNSPTATEPILTKPKEGNGGPMTRKNIVFDPHDTAGLSLMFGGGLDFLPPSPSPSSSAWPPPTRPDTYRRQPDLPERRPVPSDYPQTSDQSDQGAEDQWRLKSQYSSPVTPKTWQEPLTYRDYEQKQPLARLRKPVGSAPAPAEDKRSSASCQSRDRPFHAQEGESGGLLSPIPVDTPDRDTSSQRMAHAAILSPLVPSQPTASSFKAQTLRWAQPASSMAMSQYVAPNLSSQATFTSQTICPSWYSPVLPSSGLAQIDALRERPLKLAPKDEHPLSTILPGIIHDQRAANTANTHLSQLQNTPASATAPFLLPGIQYPPKAQLVELPGDINAQASHNPQDQQTYYAADTTLSELEASPMATGAHLF